MLSHRFVLRASLTASLLATAGCSLALKTDAEQCAADADCAARGAAFAGTTCVAHVCEPMVDPKWGCVGHVDPPKAGATSEVTVQLLDLISNQPVTGVTVKLCNKYDPPCATPIGAPVPDAMGSLTVTLASDLEAYLDIQGGTYMPSIVFLDPVSTLKNPDVALVPASAAQGLAQTAGVTLDPKAGIVLARGVDCQGERTAGVSFTLSPGAGATRFYVINNGVTTNASQTDLAGNAGFVNVAPGPPTLTATLGPGGKEMGKTTTLVRAGTMSYQLLRPTPTL